MFNPMNITERRNLRQHGVYIPQERQSFDDATERRLAHHATIAPRII